MEETELLMSNYIMHPLKNKAIKKIYIYILPNQNY